MIRRSTRPRTSCKPETGRAFAGKPSRITSKSHSMSYQAKPLKPLTDSAHLSIKNASQLAELCAKFLAQMLHNVQKCRLFCSEAQMSTLRQLPGSELSFRHICSIPQILVVFRDSYKPYNIYSIYTSNIHYIQI